MVRVRFRVKLRVSGVWVKCEVRICDVVICEVLCEVFSARHG